VSSPQVHLKYNSRIERNRAIVSKANRNVDQTKNPEELLIAMLSESVSLSNTDQTKNPESLLNNDPISYTEAMGRPDSELWKQATRNEWKSLLLNNTFELYQPEQVKEGNLQYNLSGIPFGVHAIGSKWVYKKKMNPDGTTRYKVRLVIKGYEQVEGIDFNETYAPVSKLTTARLLLSLAAKYDWRVDHLDIVTAFLNPKIDRDNVYMSLPPGIEWLDPDLYKSSTQCVRLLKALYGLKQAPRLWYEDINQFLLSIGFDQSTTDPNLYIQNGILLLLYVDDILLIYTGNDDSSGVKERIKNRYQITDLGPVKRFLGLEIERDIKRKSITLSQSEYIKSILHRYQMQSSHSVSSPMDPNIDLNNLNCHDKIVADRNLYLSIVGSLMYVALGTRPDISFSVTVLSRYNVQPLQMHLTAAKRVLRYLKNTEHYKLHFIGQSIPSESENALGICGYTDSDWAGNTLNRRSVGGCIFSGNTGGPILWQAKSQTVVALSTLEAEYIACSDATREGLWLQRLHQDIISSTNITFYIEPMPIMCDNQGALKLIETGVVKQKTKHIAVKFHHSHHEQKAGTVIFRYISSKENTADLLTKALPAPRHQHLTRMINIF
jgi:hypothetical protein